ncbi:MAG: hypothetical protein U0326_17005 [Polyangiales bacterium]
MWAAPAVTEITFSSPSTCTGCDSHATAPSAIEHGRAEGARPSCPRSLAPQHHALPSLRSAQVNAPPSDTAVMVPIGSSKTSSEASAASVTSVTSVASEASRASAASATSVMSFVSAVSVASAASEAGASRGASVTSVAGGVSVTASIATASVATGDRS